MKKLLFALALVLSTGLFAQNKNHDFNIRVFGVEANGDSLFTIFAEELNAETWCTQLSQTLGTTAETKQGEWFFRALEIPGLGKNLTLRVIDGYFKSGKKSASQGYYFRASDAKKHKKRKAKAEQSGETMARVTYAELLDSSGRQLLRSQQQAKLFLEWLIAPH